VRPEIDRVEEPTDGAMRDAGETPGSRPAANRSGTVRAKNRIAVTMRRLVITVALVVTLASGGAVGLAKMGVDFLPPQHMRKINASADTIGTYAIGLKEYIQNKVESYFHKHEEESHHEHQTIVVTSPKVQDVTITESFVCQIRAQRHIEVCALDEGYLEKIHVNEGQVVKQGDLMFGLLPILYRRKFEFAKAELQFAKRKRDNTYNLAEKNVVSPAELALAEAELAKAEANFALAEAELKFAQVHAPFDGIVDRLRAREGSKIKTDDILTTLSDNSVMWVYFNVPEKYYLEYKANQKQHEKEDRIELMLANGDVFPQPAEKRLTIEADANNENGNFKFRADFPNPDRLLRHGQTGTIKIRRPFKNSLVIPQRATFELLDKRYVWVVGDDDVAKQTLITIKNELEDIFVINDGLKLGDKIVLEGVRDVQDGQKLEGYEFRKPEEALDPHKQKFHAE
jgi:membrane fusion protein, multidrug efflux system